MLASSGSLQQTSFVTIKKEYLQILNYESVKKNSLRLNQFYNELCRIFISNYESLRQTNTLVNDLNEEQREGENVQEYPSTAFLNRFTVDFSTIIAEFSSYQISCLVRLQEQNKPEFQVYFQLVHDLKELNSVYQEVDRSKLKLDPIFKEIKLDFITYKKAGESPLRFYDQNEALKGSQRLEANIEKASGLIKAIQSKKQSIQERIKQFQPTFTRLKCKLVKNKYSVLKRIQQFVLNGKSCHAEVSEMLKECVLNHKQQLRQAVHSRLEESSELREMLNKSTQILIEHPLDQNKRWESAIKSTMDTYWGETQGIERILQRFQQYFASICSNYQEKKGKLRETITKLSQFYEDNESPFQDLMEVFAMNEQLQDRLRGIREKINEMMLLLRLHKRTCTKHGEIVLSLLKIKNKRKEGFLDGQDGKNRKDLSDFITEIAVSSPKEIIFSFYDFWLATQKDLLKSSAKLRRKNTMDSMQISHSIAPSRLNVKRKCPLKEEIWLWREFREEADINFELYENYFEDVRKVTSEMGEKFIIKNSVELETYDCVLPAMKREAVLTIASQNIVISSGDAKICIHWKSISNVQQINNFFDKVLVITTPQGKIELTKFKQGIQLVVASMQETQEKCLMGTQTKVQSKREVQLTLEEIKFIAQRREHITKDVPKTDDYKLIIEDIFEGERIDEIYELIYSDKPFTFYGREEPCFFSYTGKKSGNFNWEAEAYDQPGPQFYTLKEGITFKNCPLFSTRKITYNHPMKPSSIPFMPKQSRNIDERRMYWVSHEELIYLIKSLTFEVPMADNFEVYIIHRITKVQEGVKIEIFSNVVFVKQTSFKNIIFKNTDPEIDENMIGFMGEIRKLMKLRKAAASGARIPQEAEPPSPTKTAESAAEGEVSKLKLYNKLLIAVVLLILVFNLLHVL